MKLLFLVLLQIVSAEIQLIDGASYKHVPIYSGSEITATCVSAGAQMKNNHIALYVMDYTQFSYEEFIRKIQEEDQPALVVLKSPTYKSGRMYKLTDGKQYYRDLTTPVIEMAPTDFDDLNAALHVGNSTCTVTFSEENFYQIVDVSPTWNILLGFPISISVFAVLFCLYNLIGRCFVDASFNHRHLVLIFELGANIFRFLYCLDLNSCRRIFHYKFLRFLTTVHIPFTLATAFLIISYAYKIITQHKKAKPVKEFFEYTPLRNSLIVFSIGLFLLEIIGQLGFYISLSFYQVWITGTYIIYLLISSLIVVLFIVVTVWMCVIFKMTIIQHPREMFASTRERTQKWLRRFMLKMPLACFGFILYIVGVAIVGTAGTSVVLEMYGPLIGVVGLSITSLAFINAYTPTMKQDTNSGEKTSKTKTMPEESV